MAERASIFGAEDELDLSAFAPAPKAARPKAEAASIRKAAERSGFRSREPVPTIAAPTPREPTKQRRHLTGRNRQLNLKVTDDALARFYAIADAQGWVLGETFEKAVAALESKLK